MLQHRAEIQTLLEAVNRIAVVGIKAGPDEDAYRVPRYLQAAGYEILPVSPRLGRVLGLDCAPRLADLSRSPDLVNLFRASANIPAHTDEILSLPERPRAVWMQLGIRCDASAARLEAAGIAVVQDRCIMLDHRRWLAV